MYLRDTPGSITSFEAIFLRQIVPISIVYGLIIEQRENGISYLGRVVSSTPSFDSETVMLRACKP